MTEGHASSPAHTAQSVTLKDLSGLDVKLGRDSGISPKPVLPLPQGALDPAPSDLYPMSIDQSVHAFSVASSDFSTSLQLMSLSELKRPSVVSDANNA